MVGEEAKTKKKKKMIAAPAECQRQSYVAVIERLSRAGDSLLLSGGKKDSQKDDRIVLSAEVP